MNHERLTYPIICNSWQFFHNFLIQPICLIEFRVKLFETSEFIPIVEFNTSYSNFEISS